MASEVPDQVGFASPNAPPHCSELPRPLVITLVTLPQIAKQGATALEVVTVTDPDTGATVMTRSDLVMVIQYPTDMHGTPPKGQQPVAGVPASYSALVGNLLLHGDVEHAKDLSDWQQPQAGVSERHPTAGAGASCCTSPCAREACTQEFARCSSQQQRLHWSMASI